MPFTWAAARRGGRRLHRVQSSSTAGQAPGPKKGNALFEFVVSILIEPPALKQLRIDGGAEDEDCDRMVLMDFASHQRLEVEHFRPESFLDVRQIINPLPCLAIFSSKYFMTLLVIWGEPKKNNC